VSRANVKYTVVDRIAEVSLQRAPANAVDLETIDQIVTCLDNASVDPGVCAVLISSGLQGIFCAGLDLKAALDDTSEFIRSAVQRLYVKLFIAQRRLGKPSIAVVDGAARGAGMTLAISCDMIVASERATFGYPEINVGLIPGIHFIHLPQIVGRHRAFELLFSGRSFSAGEAQGFGLVNRVVEPSRLAREARSLAASFTEHSPTIMALGRDAFMQATDLDYRRSIRVIIDAFDAVAKERDARAGISSFKRKHAASKATKATEHKVTRRAVRPKRGDGSPSQIHRAHRGKKR
jgi:enoyl-CoA hydratase/carnithine racemase